MPTVKDWRPYQNRVQAGLRDGNFLNGQFVLLCAGPAYYSMAASGQGGLNVYPIGLTQNFALSQNKSVSRIFEIGSDRSYFIPGRTVGQLNLGRVMYHGPSLLRMLYATYGSEAAATTTTQSITPLTTASTASLPLPTAPAVAPANNTLESSTGAFGHKVQVPPGFENMFLNLASDLFNNPIGLFLLMKDSEQNTVATIYFENCYIPSHSMALDSQGLIMQESVGIQYERMFPVRAVDAVSLLKPNNADEFSTQYQL